MFDLLVNRDLIRQQMQDQVEMRSQTTQTPSPPRRRSLFRGRRLANRSDPPVHAASYRTYRPGPSTPS